MLSKALKQKAMDITQLSEEEVVKADDAVTPPAYTTEMQLTHKDDGFVSWSLGLVGFHCRHPSKHEQVCVCMYIDMRFSIPQSTIRCVCTLCVARSGVCNLHVRGNMCSVI